MRFKVIFSYDGTNYNGLQKQPNKETIQGEFEKALEKINNKKTSFTASGRTDRGVHANMQVGHCDIDVYITEYKLKRALNTFLNDDIHVIDTMIVDDSFHARFNVKNKEYYYLINTNEYNPLTRNYQYQYSNKIDLKKLNELKDVFIGTYDFSSICNVENDKKDCIRTINNIDITDNKGIIKITFNGNGFLKYMVRIMVYLLLEMEKGKLSKEDVLLYLKKEKQIKSHKKVPACGLYLNKVEY